MPVLSGATVKCHERELAAIRENRAKWPPAMVGRMVRAALQYHAAYAVAVEWMRSQFEFSDEATQRSIAAVLRSIRAERRRYGISGSPFLRAAHERAAALGFAIVCAIDRDDVDMLCDEFDAALRQAAEQVAA